MGPPFSEHQSATDSGKTAVRRKAPTLVLEQVFPSSDGSHADEELDRIVSPCPSKTGIRGSGGLELHQETGEANILPENRGPATLDVETQCKGRGTQRAPAGRGSFVGPAEPESPNNGA